MSIAKRVGVGFRCVVAAVGALVACGALWGCASAGGEAGAPVDDGPGAEGADDTASALSGSCSYYGARTVPVGWDFAGPRKVYACNVFTTARVYAAGYTTAAKISTLYAGRDWFVCQVKWEENPRTNGGINRNNYWLVTEGDSPRRWGFVPATYISQGGNYQPVPGVPNCG